MAEAFGRRVILAIMQSYGSYRGAHEGVSNSEEGAKEKRGKWSEFVLYDDGNRDLTHYSTAPDPTHTPQSLL